jgi:hypothetical protein
MPTRNNTHTVEAERQFESRSSQSFNRIAYALELLKLLNPPLTVVVYASQRQVQVEQGRALGDQPAWALCGVPPHASRASIARALVKLSGLDGAPFLVDLLVAAPSDGKS